MSTRSTINFGYGVPETDAQPESKIYRHSDGYPSWMLPDFRKFFDIVEKETQDPRYTQPDYLAAKYLVYLAREFSTPYEQVTGEYVSNVDSPRVGTMDFLSVGIIRENPGDIEYSYWLDCDNLYPKTKRPTVYVSTGVLGGTVLGWRKVKPARVQ